MIYKMYFCGRLYAEFEAKSERAAKMRVSKLCSNDPGLYCLTTGISLKDERDNHIAYYMPLFCQWLND